MYIIYMYKSVKSYGKGKHFCEKKQEAALKRWSSLQNTRSRSNSSHLTYTYTPNPNPKPTNLHP